MKTIVTGGTGFIGSHLVDRLVSAGHDVVCLAKDIEDPGRFNRKGVNLVRCNLLDPSYYSKILDGADVVFHLAGITRARRTRDYYEGNYEVTKRFFKACAGASGLKRFVYVSSLTAIGPRLDGQEVNEATDCHPVSHYGKSKLMAEQEIECTADRIPVTIVRPVAVYGPGDRDFFQYYKAIRFNIEPILGRRSKYLNLIYVSDLVEGLLLAGSHPAGAGQIFILGGETNHTTEEICDAFALAERKHPVKIRLPDSFGYAYGAIAGTFGKITRTATLFNVQKAREAAQDSWTCSIRKAKEVLGFRPKVSLHEGAVLTYDWYVQHGWLAN